MTDIVSTYLLFVLLFSDSPYADRLSLEELISYGFCGRHVENDTPPRWPRLVFKMFMTSSEWTLYGFSHFKIH